MGLFWSSLSIAVLSAVTVIIVANPRDYKSLKVSGVAETKHNNFGLMQYTGQMVPSIMEITAGDQVMDISSLISSWKRQRTLVVNRLPVYFLSSKSSRSISSLVLQQLGARNPWESFAPGSRVVAFYLDESGVARDAVLAVSKSVNTSPQDAILEIKEGRAIQFQPHVVGKLLDKPAAIRSTVKSLFQHKSSADLPIIKASPDKMLSDTNSLGIKELVAFGESDFSGSTASRINNIRVGSEKFNGVILAPEEEFSFNHFLGPVTAEAGFKPELVIKSNGTIPELGGGLCQVSTTAFRAALYGGLKIAARKNHSYAVKYYAPQGTDATIYPGVVDFKFVNDTRKNLLVWTRMEDNKLYFEFYGTKDNRTVEIDGPYQYDFGPGNAMKARMTRVVTNDSGVQKDDFYSKYVSQDLFPRIYEYPDNTTSPEQKPENVNGQNQENQGQQNPDSPIVPADSGGGL